MNHVIAATQLDNSAIGYVRFTTSHILFKILVEEDNNLAEQPFNGESKDNDS